MRLTALLTLVLSIYAASSGFAQTSAVVFTEMGEEFTLYLNGVKQNDAPLAVVNVADLSGQFYIARIDFADNSLPDFSHNNFAVQPGIINNYVVKPNRNGKYVMRYFPGSAPVAPAPAPTPVPEPAAAPPSTVAPPAATISMENRVLSTGMPDVKVSETARVVPTDNATSTAPATEEVKIEMSVGGTDVKIDMAMPNVAIDMTMDSEMTVEQHTRPVQTQEIVLDGGEVITTGGIPEPVAPAPSCTLSSTDFNALSASIKSKSFSDTKMTIAKQALASRCPSSAQVRDLMMLFDFEDDRLTLAMYAHDRVSDPANYYQVNDAFDFEMTIDELNDYILSK